MTKNQDVIKFILAAEAVQEAIVANMTIGKTKIFEATKVDASKINKLINIARSHIDALIYSENVAEDDIKAVIKEINDISKDNKKYFEMINSNVNGHHQPDEKLDISKDNDVKEVVRQLKIWSDRLEQLEINFKQRFNIQ